MACAPQKRVKLADLPTRTVRNGQDASVKGGGKKATKKAAPKPR